MSEPTCPFCRSALSDAFRATPARQAPRVRLARAAVFALSTGVALTPACSSSSSPGTDDGADAATDGALYGSFYGSFPIDASRGVEPVRFDAGSDAAIDASASDAGDAGPSDAESGM